jgi:4-hydroxy-tetrahydrodipicolinate synthase
VTGTIERPRVVAAMPTPFDDHEELDVAAVAVLASRLVGAGCDALFVGGTTGEFPALTNEERVSLIESSAEAVGPERIMAHVGSACARDSERLARRAAAFGVRDIAAANPYFLPADTDCQFDYFQRISEATGDARLWLYIFPERTGNEISTHLLEKLLDLPNVHGAKVSSPGIAPIKDLRAVTAGRLLIFSGGDPDLVEAFSCGVSGLVSGNCAVVPDAYVALADAVGRGDDIEMEVCQQQIRRIASAIGGGSGGIKAALRALGQPIGRPRMAVSDKLTEELALLVKNLSVLSMSASPISGSPRSSDENVKV